MNCLARACPIPPFPQLGPQDQQITPTEIHCGIRYQGGVILISVDTYPVIKTDGLCSIPSRWVVVMVVLININIIRQEAWMLLAFQLFSNFSLR